MGLGVFVSFMQAFVFTMLSMIYIAGAVVHEEEHH
jgi:F0F1-type ATP synthase membrane subunit a